MRRRVIGWLLAAVVFLPTAGLAAHGRPAAAAPWWRTVVVWILDITGIERDGGRAKSPTPAINPDPISNAGSWIDPAGET